ncbi:hypothetical protein Tco_0573978 [Tanacetum coccineum]
MNRPLAVMLGCRTSLGMFVVLVMSVAFLEETMYTSLGIYIALLPTIAGVRRAMASTSMSSADVLSESSRGSQVNRGPTNGTGSSYKQPRRTGLLSDYKHIGSCATTFTLKEMQFYAIRVNMAFWEVVKL